MKKKIRMHEKRETKNKKEDVVPDGAVPAYLLDRCVHALLPYFFPFQAILFHFSREGQSRAKVLSNMIKQKRKEKAVSMQ